MSWVNLKRLLPSRKVWKLLKNKLPLKLHKLSKSKANKKPHQKISTKTGCQSSLSIHPKKIIKIRHHDRDRYYKSPKPVYIDQLFVKPVSGVNGLAGDEEEGPGKGKSRMKKGCTSAVGGNHNMMMSADEMWESMVLTSPHVHGIDERAEEFIARIKAQMRHQ